MGRGGLFALAAAAALAAHIAALSYWPGEVFTRAGARLPAGRFEHFSRNLEQDEAEIALSACAYDLADGPIAITLGDFDGVTSLTLYAEDGSAFFVTSDRESEDGRVRLVLYRQGRPEPGRAGASTPSPSRRGVAVVRRLAPSSERFEQAEAARRNDRCAPFTPPPL